MPPRQMNPHAQRTAPRATPKRVCPACQEELVSAAQLVEIEVRKRGKLTGKKINICSECNRRTVAVLMLLEPDFPDELHISLP